MNAQQLTPRQQAAYLRAIAMAFIISIAVYVVLGIVLANDSQPSVDQRLALMLGVLFLPLGIMLAAGSFVVRRVIANLPARDAFAAKTRATIVPMVIAEAPAILGLVHAILSAQLTFAAILWAISFVACVIHFPRRGWIEGN